MAELTEDVYRNLKSKVEETKSQADKAQGALDQLMVRLKEDYGCETLKEARDKLAELEVAQTKAKKAFDAAVAAYEEKWGEHD